MQLPLGTIRADTANRCAALATGDVRLGTRGREGAGAAKLLPRPDNTPRITRVQAENMFIEQNHHATVVYDNLRKACPPLATLEEQLGQSGLGIN